MFGLVGTAVQTELVTMNGDRTVHGKIVVVIYIVSQKMALMHYNFDADQPILAIFSRDVAERVCYQMVICCLTSVN